MVKETAVLFQSGIYKKMDYNILVRAEEEVRIKRIQSRDKERSLNQIESILKAQGDWVKWESKADFVIENNENKALLPQIKKIMDKIPVF